MILQLFRLSRFYHNTTVITIVQHRKQNTGPLQAHYATPKLHRSNSKFTQFSEFYIYIYTVGPRLSKHLRMCHFNVKGIQISDFVWRSELSDKYTI